MMRILILNSEYPPIGGGAGNACAHIANRLVKMGHDVLIITSRFENLPHNEQIEGVTIRRIPALRRSPDRSGVVEQLLFSLSATFSTFSLVRRFKPNATLAFFGVPSGAVALFLKYVHKIPYVVSLRGGDVPGFRPYDFKIYHKLFAPFLRIIWKNASALVANSNGLRDLALQFDQRFEIPIIPNGVDLKIYKSSIHDSVLPRLFSVGRIVHQKGLDLALRALAGLKDFAWEWCIAGDGPQMELLKSLAHELGIQDRIHFLGWQSREQLIEQYQKSNLFVFPSRHEGMPNAVLEAMASGLPIVASQIAGNEELVLDGETGFLFPSENVEALSLALKKLLNDVALRQQMGTASRSRVEKCYSWENTAEQYAILLEQVK